MEEEKKVTITWRGSSVKVELGSSPIGTPEIIGVLETAKLLLFEEREKMKTEEL